MASHGLPRVAKEKDAEKERKLIEDYRVLTEQVTTKVRRKEFTLEVFALTTRLLRKNPEYYTIWNYRRRILSHLFITLSGAHDPSSAEEHQKKEPPTLQLIEDDLQFLLPLLKEFPKCYWIWKYRLWLLERSEGILPREQATKLWKQELGLASHHLSRDERNFHGWNYRRRVVSQLERLSGSSLTGAEFAYSTAMIQKALQNFSALHYRSKLIPRLLDERSADSAERRRMLDAELDLMHNALIDPYNQSAWFYHQALIDTLQPKCPRESAIVLDLSEEDRLGYYDREIDFVREMLEDFDDCKWIYQALIQYVMEYQALKGGNIPAFSNEIQHWVSELQRLDPLRAGRWKDMQKQLQL